MLAAAFKCGGEIYRADNKSAARAAFSAALLAEADVLPCFDTVFWKLGMRLSLRDARTLCLRLRADKQIWNHVEEQQPYTAINRRKD